METPDPIEALKEEMAKAFGNTDKNLDKLQSLQEPIANAKPRMKSMMDGLTQGVLDIKPFVPKSFTLFHGIADILSAVQAPANAQMAREIKEADRDLHFRRSESLINRDNAYADFLNNWKMPPSAATAFASSGIGNAAAAMQGTEPPPGSPARPPGPASAVVTPPYAGVLAGGSSGSTGGSSGGSELRDILAVLREILELMRKSKAEGKSEEEDESETVENRRPFFKEQKKEEEGSTQIQIKESTLPSGPLPNVTRSPQATAQESIISTNTLVAAARFLDAL